MHTKSIIEEEANRSKDVQSTQYILTSSVKHVMSMFSSNIPTSRINVGT